VASARNQPEAPHRVAVVFRAGGCRTVCPHPTGTARCERAPRRGPTGCVRCKPAQEQGQLRAFWPSLVRRRRQWPTKRRTPPQRPAGYGTPRSIGRGSRRCSTCHQWFSMGLEGQPVTICGPMCAAPGGYGPGRGRRQRATKGCGAVVGQHGRLAGQQHQ
jgi:hypothetical protein